MIAATAVNAQGANFTVYVTPLFYDLFGPNQRQSKATKGNQRETSREATGIQGRQMQPMYQRGCSIRTQGGVGGGNGIGGIFVVCVI